MSPLGIMEAIVLINISKTRFVQPFFYPEQDRGLYKTGINNFSHSMKAAGIIFILLGITGSTIFGINILNNSKIISFFGINFSISPDNWTPLVISLLILIIGVILLSAVKKAEKNPEKSHISGERQQ